MARFSISKERTTMLVRIHSVLTPDQRRGLDAIAKRHDERTRADNRSRYSAPAPVRPSHGVL